MEPFRHDRLQRMGRLLERLNVVFGKYNDNDLDVPSALIDFLDNAVAEYRALSLATGENALLALKAQCVSARQGVNPHTLERVTSFRRAMERAIALSVLQQSAQQLRVDIGRDQESLAEARARLVPIVLTAMQRGLILPEHHEPADQQTLYELWQSLLRDPELQIGALQVTVMANKFDILLLLSDLIGLVPSPM